MKSRRASCVVRIASIVFISIVSLFIVRSPSRSMGLDDTTLRVCVLKDADQMVLTIRGSYKILALKTNQLIKKGRSLRKAKVVPTSSGLLISGEPFDIYGINIVPRRNASIYIGRRSFRGNLDIIRTEEKRLLVINHIDVEDYLKGVLYHEVSHWWPIEALKAQAIAARTYALYQKSIRKDFDYDLTSDIYSQVYGGRLSEKLKTNRAVKLTRGMVLTYKNEIFPTYYHATCGGRTEDASNLWDIDLPPLKGVKCDFCRHSPHYKWRYKVSVSKVERKLREAGYKIGGLKRITLRGKTSSGRIKELGLISKEEVAVPTKDFRMILGPNSIRSTNFQIRVKGKRLYFEGRGWGHGAGMCQWGAFFLSLKRYKADRILRHYYPHTKLTRYRG